MSKLKPNIITPFNDKQRFKDLVLEVINDTSIYAFIPDSISLSDGLFILTLTNKKFVYEEIKVDGEPDYVDVYLQGIKKTANTYSVSTSGNDIVITFNQNITLRPIDIVRTDFLVKGKIVSRQ
jgi:hypothetical protein